MSVKRTDGTAFEYSCDCCKKVIPKERTIRITKQKVNANHYNTFGTQMKIDLCVRCYNEHMFVVFKKILKGGE